MSRTHMVTMVREIHVPNPQLSEFAAGAHGFGVDAQHPTMAGAITYNGRVKSVRAAPLEDYDDQPKGLWSRFKQKVGLGYDEFDEDGEFIEEVGGNGRPAMLRVHSSRINRVSVWLTIASFENAQQAADGLKDGHQQIVNLEKATPEVCARVIDFLNGVTYALDGFVEKVGEKVFLFTPSNYVIEIENGAEGRRVRSPFRDN